MGSKTTTVITITKASSDNNIKANNDDKTNKNSSPDISGLEDNVTSTTTPKIEIVNNEYTKDNIS